MSNRSDRRDEEDPAHLEAVDAGAGCAEIWEHLSERRSEGAPGED